MAHCCGECPICKLGRLVLVEVIPADRIAHRMLSNAGTGCPCAEIAVIRVGLLRSLRLPSFSSRTAISAFCPLLIVHSSTYSRAKSEQFILSLDFQSVCVLDGGRAIERIAHSRE